MNPVRSEERMRHREGIALATLVKSLEIWDLDRPEKRRPGTCAHPWYCVNAARHGGTEHWSFVESGCIPDSGLVCFQCDVACSEVRKWEPMHSWVFPVEKQQIEQEASNPSSACC